MATGNHEVTQASATPHGLESTPPEVGVLGTSGETIELFSLLRSDHVDVVRRMERLAEVPRGDPARVVAWKTVSAALLCHVRAEEDALYRLMSRMPHGIDAAESAIEERDVIQELVERIDTLGDLHTAEFELLFARLRSGFDSHVLDEEREIVPLVAAMFDADELRRLAHRFRRLRERYRSPSTNRGGACTYEAWPPDALYELAQIRRIKGRGRLTRAELIQALRRFRP